MDRSSDDGSGYETPTGGPAKKKPRGNIIKSIQNCGKAKRNLKSGSRKVSEVHLLHFVQVAMFI